MLTDEEKTMLVNVNLSESELILLVEDILKTYLSKQKANILARLPEDVITDKHDSDYSKIKYEGYNKAIGECKKIISEV